MDGDYSDVLDGLPEVLILERWPGNQPNCPWESAQMFALVLDEEDDWSLEKHEIIQGYNNQTFDMLHKRKIVLPVLDSTKFACRLDLERLRAGLSKGGELAEHMYQIELGRTLDWDDDRQEEIGELDEEAVQAIDNWQSLVDFEPYFTCDTVLTVTEHLLGIFYEESPRSVMRQYGLRKNSSEKRIAAVAEIIKAEFLAQETLAYGSYASALKEIIELEACKDDP